MKTLDLTQLKNDISIDVDESLDFELHPRILTDTSLKSKVTFNYDTSNIKHKIVYRCVADKNTDIDIELTLSMKNKDIVGIEAFLEVYILNLGEENEIKIKPYLEIPQQNVNFEHKVAIGSVNENWLKYMQSRGLNHKQALDLIIQAFI